MIKEYEIRSIDSWKIHGHWQWNDTFHLGYIRIDDDKVTPRNIFKALRERGYLSDHSKGKVKTVDFGEADIEIQIKNTGEPIFALLALEE